MSCEAKVWDEEDGSWRGIHDHTNEPCSFDHSGTQYDLLQVLEGIEQCIGKLRWKFRAYPNDKIGLVGYIS